MNRKIKIQVIQKAIQVLNNGGVILYPTDTIWGIGCDANNETAIKKVYSIKNQRKSLLSSIILRLSSNICP